MPKATALPSCLLTGALWTAPGALFLHDMWTVSLESYGVLPACLLLPAPGHLPWGSEFLSDPGLGGLSWGFQRGDMEIRNHPPRK